MTKPREILVRGPNWAGDLAMATPGFRALRGAWPDARITLLVRRGLEPLVAGAPWFDAVVPITARGSRPLALLREAFALRRRRWDLAISLPDSFSSALLLRLAGARRVVGYRRGLRGLLLDEAVPPPEGAGARMLLPRERHVLALMEAVGATSRGTELELFVTEGERQRMRAVLREAGVAADAPIAVIAPGASFGPSKAWPVDRFAHVADGLARDGAAVVLTGSPGEAALAERVAECMREPATNLCGRLDLGGLKALVRDSALLVCNDAGARHVAVAFGVPCLVIMGPTSLAKTGLNLERVRVFTAEVGCRPCYLRRCPTDHRCMTRIEPERVLAAARPALAEGGRDGWRGDGVLRPVPDHGGREA